MRTETHEFEALCVWFAIDKNQVWPHMAVAMIPPFPHQRMIDVAWRQGDVGGEASTTSLTSASSFLPKRPDFSRR
jgi:hypothetical protein